ncbi:MAG: translocation/assembly module TamB domain-containing protein [Candidatus Palauibacterales bacterium]|nr:translocation/assembly module TamB domain-containing protein [Candidatus Palauibacterales bacterium]
MSGDRRRAESRDPWSHGPLGMPRPLWRAIKVVGRSMLLLVGLASLTAAGAIILLSQTVVGRAVVASHVEELLAGVVHGEVRVGPILGGNMLTRAHLAHFEILESDGTPFVELDSVRVSYNPLGFLIGTYRFSAVTVERARISLVQAPDRSWNFDRLFGDETPDSAAVGESSAPDSAAGSGRTKVLLTDLNIRRGSLLVTTPWASDETGAARDSLVAQGLRGDKLWRVVRLGPDRWAREIRLDSLSGGFPLLRLVDPIRPFRIEATGLATEASVVTQTLDIRRFDGSATFRDTIAVEIETLETQETALQGSGWVVPGDPEQFRFGLEADPIAFGDLQWLPVPMPRQGGGPARIDLSTRGDVIVVDVSGADASVGDSRARGSFVLALEPMPRFESLDLLLQPLRLRLVDEVLEREPLIDGYITGTVTGDGPLDLIQMHADLTLADVDGEVRPSFVTAVGGLALIEPRDMQNLELTFLEFEPRWTAVVGITHPLRGRLEGRTTLTGTVGQWFDFEADLTHQLPTGQVSHLSGSGSVVLEDEPGVTVEFLADPLSLAALQPYAPSDVELVGDVRGPLSARGLFSDLRVIADLRTPRGLVNFDGRFDLMAEERRYDARLTARDIQLRQWVGQAPATRLAVEGRVRGVGTDPATLEATFDLTILRSLVEGATVDSSLLKFTLSEGLATADTFAIQTDAGRVRGRGSFGLAEETSGSLILDVDAPNLAAWNRWIVPGRNPARQDTSLEGLFAAFPGELEDERGAAAPSGTASPDTLAGSMQALGVLYGNVHDFSFGGRLHGRELRYGDWRADSALLTVDIEDPRVMDRLTASATLWQLEGAGTTLDTVEVLWVRQDSAASELDLFARRGSALQVDARTRLRWTAAERRFSLERLATTLGTQRLTLADPAEIVWGDEGFASSGLHMRGSDGAVFRVAGAVPDSGPADLTVEISGLDLASLFAVPDEALPYGGVLDASGSLRGTADDPRWNLAFEVSDPNLRGLEYENLEGDADYADGQMTLGIGLRDNGMLLGRLDGSISTDLALRKREHRLAPDPLRLVLEADSLPIEPLELAFGSLRDVSGYGAGRIEFSGEPDDLQMQGAATLTAAGATLAYLGVRFEDVSASLTFDGTRAVLESASLNSSAGGSASMRGAIETREPTNLGFDLTILMRRFRAMDRRMATFLLDGQGHLGGSYRSPELTGTFRVSEGQVRAERFMRMRQAVDLTDPTVTALIDTTLVMEQRLFERAQNPFMQNLRMNAEITVGPDFWLRSQALEVELAGTLDVQMDRARGDLVAFGTLNLPRGKYRYVSGSGTDLSSLYSRQLQIAGGSITFTGAPGMDPNLDIQAQYETRSELGPVTITVDIGGTATAPTLQTSSDPPLPAADEVCFLLFSTACLGAGAEGGEFAASLVRESLLGTVSNQFSQVLVSGVGLVDYFDIRSTGQAGTIDSGNTTSLLYGTEVEIGRYLTPELFVRATQPLGGQLPGFGLEWSFSGFWRLEFVTEDSFRRYASYGYSFSSFSRRTYGVMLFRDWNF